MNLLQHNTKNRKKKPKHLHRHVGTSKAVGKEENDQKFSESKQC